MQNILQLAHGDGHPGYAKCFERIASSWYIRGLSRYLREYLKHCSECQVYQTKRHAPYGSMQPVLTPAVPFHTITMDFILALPVSRDGFDVAMPVSDKFTKRITIIPGKSTWTAAQWGDALLDRLDTADWGLPKAIISDRDRKFLSDLWLAIFKRLGVKLLYSTAYHPQTDGQSERTNQTVEIALRFYMAAMEDATEWPEVLPRIQRHFNNSTSAATGKTPNEASYGFTPVQASDLWKPSPDAAAAAVGDSPTPANPLAGISFAPAARARVEVADAIAFAQMEAKRSYDEKHKPVYMREGDYALIRLHHGYDIPSTAVLGRKYSQQYVGPFRVLKRVGRLAYRLDLPAHWRIHPVLSIAQLEPAPAPKDDPFQRPKPDHPDSVFVEGDTDRVKSYEIERLVNKRQTKRRGPEYLVRWRGYGPEHDDWRNLPELGDAQQLVKDYEDARQKTVTLPGRLTSAGHDETIAGPEKRRPGRPRKSSAALLPPATSPSEKASAALLPPATASPEKPSTALLPPVIGSTRKPAVVMPPPATASAEKAITSSRPKQSFAVIIPTSAPLPSASSTTPPSASSAPTPSSASSTPQPSASSAPPPSGSNALILRCSVRFQKKA